MQGIGPAYQTSSVARAMRHIVVGAFFQVCGGLDCRTPEASGHVPDQDAVSGNVGL
jgi:hypothetical protein